MGLLVFIKPNIATGNIINNKALAFFLLIVKNVLPFFIKVKIKSPTMLAMPTILIISDTNSENITDNNEDINKPLTILAVYLSFI